MGFAAIGVYVEEDRFRIRIKPQPQSAWQDWLDGRTYSCAEALDILTSLGLERTRAEQMIEFAVMRGAPAPEVESRVQTAPPVQAAAPKSDPTAFSKSGTPTLTGRPRRCPSCDVPALASAPNGSGYFCLACGFTSDQTA